MTGLILSNFEGSTPMSKIPLSIIRDTANMNQKDLEARIATVQDRLRREQNRIKKMRAFGIPPQGRETEDSKLRAHKILIKEQICHRLILELQHYNERIVRLKDRYQNMITVSDRKGEYSNLSEKELTRLEKNKIVPTKSNILAHHRNSPGAFMDKVKSMAQLVREEKKRRKTFKPEIQAEIDRVFVDSVSEDDFEAMMSDD